jgi:hypothetical protein
MLLKVIFKGSDVDAGDESEDEDCVKFARNKKESVNMEMEISSNIFMNT